jgi:hypothetical protein
MSTQERTNVTKAELYCTAGALLTLLMLWQISVITQNRWLQMIAFGVVIVTQVIFGVAAARAKKAVAKSI